MSLIVAGPTHSYRRWTVAGQVETKLDASDTKPAWSVSTTVALVAPHTVSPI
jgi:hypothetical protein